MTRSDKVLVIALLVVVGAAIVIAAFMASYALPVQDLAQYWAAAHLVRQNPYSIDSTNRLEQLAGSHSTIPLVIKNPPWAIIVLLPLALMSYHAAFAAWTFMSVIVLGASAFAIARELCPKPSLALPMLPFVFGPTFVLLTLGQFTVLVLLGIILFCLFVRARQDWLAGVSLLLVFGKPHVALLFVIAIALWITYARRWIILVSATLALASASLLALLINPRIFQQFLQRSLLVVHETEAYPNIGGILYNISGVHSLALLPQIIGLVWVIIYWIKHRSEWVWEREGMIVLLVSVTCSYYSYPYDEVLALPALIGAFAVGNRRAFLLAFILADLGYAVYISNIAGGFGYGYMFLWWTALGWLAAFLLAQTRLLQYRES